MALVGRIPLYQLTLLPYCVRQGLETIPKGTRRLVLNLDEERKTEF
jgi:hypothetical protein